MAALVGTVMGLRYNKMHGIACLAEELLAFQGCLCSMELPNFFEEWKKYNLGKIGHRWEDNTKVGS